MMPKLIYAPSRASSPLLAARPARFPAKPAWWSAALALCAAMLLTLAISQVARAGGDHDHGPPLAPLASSAPAPRAVAESEDFELVAVLEDEQLLIYLDRPASNEPVEDARIEVESNGVTTAARHLYAGVYAVPGESFREAGKHALVFTVSAGGLDDLLITTLDIAAPDAAHAHSEHTPAWLVWGAVGLLLLGALGFALARRRRRTPGLGVQP